MSFYSGMKKVFGPFFRLTFGVTVEGEENIPADKGFLICANHTSMLDVVMLVIAFKKKLNFMAKKEIFKFAPFAAFFRGMGAFPVDRGGADVKAIRTTINKVSDGEAVCMFPQGTRRKFVNPATTPVRSGVGMVAYHTGCDVLPVFIQTKGNHVRIFKKTHIIIGKPISNSDFAFEKGGRTEYDSAAGRVFYEVCALGGYDYPLLTSGEKADKSDKAEE